MSKVAYYLQEHLAGEVITSADARRHFSTDGSILTATPALVVYPKNENDVRKTARFTWQLAERGRVIPITARGAGTDQAGAAIGTGIIMAFPAHMNRILEFDDKTGMVVVEVGANYGKVQQALNTHGRFLPPFPSSMEYSTIGGAIGNNTAGEKSVKYGATREFTKSLRVVLANGEAIETTRLSKRELNKKLGLSSFEGEIYRALDKLIEENQEVIAKLQLNLTKNAAGYALGEVKGRDGSFDLTPLIVGSQGTLGIVTEAAMSTEVHSQETSLLAAHFDSLQALQEAVIELRGLPEMPSALEMVDDNLLQVVDKIAPNLLTGAIEKPYPRAVLLVEFDNPSERARKKLTKKARKILDKRATKVDAQTDPEAQEKLWRIRHSSAAVVAHGEGGSKALPFIEDGVVPPENFEAYLQGIKKLFERHRLDVAIWGHAGDANLHVQPFLNLAEVGDRQKIFRLLDEHAELLLSLGGSTSGEHGDGRIRAPYLPKLYGADACELFNKVKQIFDPYGTLNPGVITNVTIESVRPMLRSSYSIDGLFNHLPRS